ncbi:unnamed protein product [Schistosoma margrebowiei]|uniref:Uncharacterized protein n=1 Tax=Schistosoma margrebowiei TaxID=48269 RepID=A0A183L978_9TREM|nr:unnamed protein product [Schistosoma margrebowiei]
MQNTSDPLAGHYQQQPTVKENKPDSSEERNQEEVLEVDRTHTEEITQLRHKANPHMKSSRPKEKRNNKEQITSRNGDRYEKNEQQLDITGNEVPGQSGLECGDWWPMLHWEEMSSVIERRQSQTKSFSNNKNGTRKLSHENIDNNIHNRTNNEEDEWYTRQLEEIKHLPIHEILQRILH